jgi:hypothetical protein
MTFNPTSPLFMLPVMLFLIELGLRFRITHKAPPESTAIFALFGLLRRGRPSRPSLSSATP